MSTKPSETGQLVRLRYVEVIRVDAMPVRPVFNRPAEQLLSGSFRYGSRGRSPRLYLLVRAELCGPGTRGHGASRFRRCSRFRELRSYMKQFGLARKGLGKGNGSHRCSNRWSRFPWANSYLTPKYRPAIVLADEPCGGVLWFSEKCGEGSVFPDIRPGLPCARATWESTSVGEHVCCQQRYNCNLPFRGCATNDLYEFWKYFHKIFLVLVVICPRSNCGVFLLVPSPLTRLTCAYRALFLSEQTEKSGILATRPKEKSCGAGKIAQDFVLHPNL